jgi:transposase
MSTLADQVDVVVGVDTHKDTHTAALVSPSGAEMRSIAIATTKKGYEELVEFVGGWPQARRVWAIEGVSSYGAGLCRVLARRGERIIEIDHPARPARRNGSKSDALDAVRAAREALARPVLGEPRSGDDREALRVLHVTRESAIHARTQAINAVHALVVTAPDTIRDRLRDLSSTMLLRRCGGLRVRGDWSVDVQATVTALRCTARRALALEQEADELQRAITVIIERVAPTLVAQPGVGPITAAVIFCAWSHPGRCRNEAAFAALAGVAPIPASSGLTVRYRLNRCGDRQLNRALHTIVTTRLRIDPDTISYVARRTTEGKSRPEIRRCLKRYIARDLYRLLERAGAQTAPTDSIDTASSADRVIHETVLDRT